MPARPDLAGPSPGDHNIAVAVTTHLKAAHLLRHPLDKEIAARCFKTFFQMLDPRKMYFYQSDIDQFLVNRDNLCDLIRKGDVTFAHDVFLTFLERIDERVKTVDELLAGQLDFKVDDQMVIDRTAAQYPRDAYEAADHGLQKLKIAEIKWDPELWPVVDPSVLRDYVSTRSE